MNGAPLEFQVHRKLIELGRFQLELLEDLESDYNDAQSSVLDTINKFNLNKTEKDLLISIIIQGCIFTPNKLGYLRKRVLDRANSAARELSDEFKKYQISL